MTNLPDERNAQSGIDTNVPLTLNEPVSTRNRRRPVWQTAAVIVGTISSVLLIKFAFDLFLIVFLLSCLAIVLHVGGKLVAESELLSPAWIVISLLLIATAVWFFTPEDTLQRALRFERYTPRFVGDFFEWSQQRGWAQRALVAPAAGAGADAGTGGVSSPASSGGVATFSAPAPSGTTGFGQSSRGGIGVAVGVSHATARIGQVVTITATVSFPRPPAANAATIVQFYDGSLQIGSAPIQLAGTTATASMTTTALLLGEHTITAAYRGSGLFGLGTVTSSPATVTVTQ